MIAYIRKGEHGYKIGQDRLSKDDLAVDISSSLYARIRNAQETDCYQSEMQRIYENGREG